MSSPTSLNSNNLSEQIYQPATLIELLRRRAVCEPGKVGYIFLADGESQEVSLNYGELDRQARAIAARLQRSTVRGDRALLLYPPGLDYVAAFFGCLYAGLIAVPAYPPDPSKFSRSLPRLQTMVADSRATVTLTPEAILTRAGALLEESPLLQSLHWMSFDKIPQGLEDEWQESFGSSNDLAFLQYTSGSTGAPKGVMLSHENLLHNASLVYHGVEHASTDKYVSWLPTFHDMGFMAGILQPLYAGIPVVSMSPVAFLQRPFLWLQAISRYQATTSGGPNFAYDLCLRKITPEQRAELDLNRWTVAFNGAEPIRPETLERFSETFAPCGFRREAFYPCYGLAEATLIVTGSAKAKPPVVKNVVAHALENNLAVEASSDDEANPMVGCGHVLLDQKVAVVHPEKLTRCMPGEVGEIWVSGSSVAQGYWGRPEESEQTFHAYTIDTGEGPFLRTGDLGFVSDGELYVTGRLKDLIIIRGLNHYPQDIESSVERSHPALRPGCGAAFSIEAEGEERLVIVQEIDYRQQPDVNHVLENIRAAVAEEHELQVHAIALIKVGRIPKTTSGKIQRRASRAAFLAGKLEVVAEWRANTAATAQKSETPVPQRTELEIAGWLVSQVAARLGITSDQVGISQPIARYGLDSLVAIELMHSIETEFGVVLPITSFLQSYSIAELATQISGLVKAAPSRPQSLVSSRATEFPLSYGQRALWFLHKLAPESPVYNISAALKIETGIDIDQFRRAFEQIVDRHAVLRTTFSIVDGEPVQRVHEDRAFDFREEDAVGWNEELLRRRLVLDAHSPFNLEHGPLLRVSLYRRSSDEYILLLVVHHIAADFWSLAVILNELTELYTAKGARVNLNPPTSSYADYVRFQTETLTGSEGERLWTYWQKQLDGVPHVLNLPTDRPRPPVQTYRGSSFTFEVNAELTNRLRELGRNSGITLYMTLLASFQLLIHRYTNQDQFLVGSPTAGRSRADLADLVGYFVNPVALRADFSQDLTFAEHLDRVRETVLGAFEHQDFPFPLLVERLQPEREPSRSPLFEVVFALQKTHGPAGKTLSSFALGESGARFKLGDLPLESLALDERVAQFDLTLMMSEEDDTLAASLQYNADLFDPQTMERMATHFQSLLEVIVTDPQQHFSALPLLPPSESQRMLSEWNDTSCDYAADTCVHSLFEAQVKQTPDAIAVTSGQQSLTYQELNARSNQLARYLRRLGVGPEVPVGILMERSIEMVVSILGVLKADGAYLPLDPAYSHDRLTFMLEDAGAPVLLTQSSLAQTFTQDDSIKIFCVDNDWHWIAEEEETDLDGRGSAANLAYVIYTSGSTGRPKGVEIAHSGLTNLVDWHQRAYGVTSGDRATQLAGPAFDASVWELWPYLTSGASIHIPDEETRVSPFKLLQWLADNAITICFLPTPLAEAVVEETLPASLKLRAILTGGDVLHRRPHKALPLMLVNHYGPTENTVVTTRGLVVQEADAETLPPIGTPIANTQVFLLNKHMQPVPVGVPGELFIGGVGLARGYRERPELTAEKFIPNPFSDNSGGRLYRTGDLARYLPDGQIEFLGRIDRQVKVRGFRIELGEIEVVLGTHPDVNEAIVVAWEDTPGNTRLAAYVVPSSSEWPTAGQLQSFLREKLPEYMIPAAVLFVNEMPLTANGKIDRDALPSAADFISESSSASTLPRTLMEELLAGIWCRVLGVERVGRHDNFFELGGHSLLATQVISRIRETLKVNVSLQKVFVSPTIAALAEEVEKALYFEHRADVPNLAPVLRDGDLPLSFAQQRLWFLDQLEPGNALYNIPAAVRLRGRLDPSVLEQSLNEIVRRHESLRTAFRAIKGKPVQVISAPQQLPLSVVDLRELPASERIEQANALMDEERRRPFDLTVGPLMRVSLLQLETEEYVLLLTMHHIVSDGWSLGVLLRELTTLYADYAAGKPSRLQELPIQYADFAQWQREWLSGEALNEELEYWRRQLAGAPLLPQLPTDRVRPPVQTFRGALIHQEWSPELSRQLKRLSQQEGVTLFMTLLAAFQLLLSRWSGQEEVVVGAPIAGRTQLETEALIGFFVNTLVLRTSVTGNPSVRELLQRVREVCLKAYAHQNMPFEKLVEELQPQRNLSYSPLFQVMFAEQDSAAIDSLTLNDVEIGTVASDTTTSKFDLTLFVSEGQNGLVGTVEYNTDLFDDSTIRRLLQHYTHLLEALINTSTEQPVSALSMLSASEQRQLLHDWNQTDSDYPQDRLLHQWFEARAERTPEAIALVYEDQELCYAELNERANQLAHCLRGLGVGREARVGVMLERRPAMLIGLLAVLKAGGAYVPLDPQYPQERVEFMLADAEVQVLLTELGLRERVAKCTVSMIYVDGAAEWIGRESRENPDVTVEAENLAYVIYTSGSTGIPKGVAITHGSASAFLHWSIEFFTAAKLQAVLASTSINFDLSIFELFAPLSVGGTVILAENALQLATLAAASRVELINTVPSAMAELLRQGAIPASVRVINLAGEALSRKLVQEIYGLGTVAQVTNLYGPSEDTTYSTWEVVPDAADEAVLIGRPISNTQVYLLDGEQQPVAIGVTGELYLGGAGLARGYLNRAVLTAERFVPNPFSKEAGGRLYRTGDLARYRADGRIEYLGRLDQQVKVRGFRIELGEIEARLEQHEQVRQCVVTAREAADGEKQIVAYVVGEAITGSELRAYLKERLPEYMIPRGWVMLDELPLTANGKVDRKRLPAGEFGRTGLAVEYEAPRTPTEEVVAGIWAEVLKVERVGVFDNFFELGGHSLLATQVISRVREAFQTDVALRSLFEDPTVGALAARIEREQSTVQRPDLRPIARDEKLELSFTQQRLWFLDQLQPGSAFYNIAAAVQLDGELNVAALKESFAEVVRRHESLRTRFSNVDGSPLQIIEEDLPFTWQENDLSSLTDAERQHEVKCLAVAEARQPFDLPRGPLLRGGLLKLSETQHVLLVTMHHIVSDGWSIGVLVQELAALYSAFSNGQPSPLPELPVQYADFAHWQRQWLTGPTLQTQLDYWLEHLADAPTMLELPTDRPRPAIQSFRGSIHSFILPEPLSESLKAFSRSESVTLFTTLMAGLQALFYRYTGQRDFMIGSPIANRSHVATEKLIGCFTNTLVLRADVSGNPTFRELLQRVWETVLGAHAHQDVPFEMLVEELQPERDLSRSPLFQMMFVLQNAFAEGGMNLPGLDIQLLETDSGTARFDITLSISETAQGLAGTWEYNTDLFDASTIQRLHQHYVQILQAIATVAANESVSTLPLLLSSEREQIVDDWNATERDYPADRLLHQWFEAQVERTPESIAVIAADQQLTYRELNTRANQLAHYLLSLQVGSEMRVGIMLERTPLMFVSLLAVLKAGGTYVPLDPNYPQQRIAFMLEDADIQVLLTESHLSERLPANSAVSVCLDREWASIAVQSEQNPVAAAGPANLSHVIYTSGSTGIPKGVAITHRNASAFVQWSLDFFTAEKLRTVLASTSINFDLSVFEMFAPLACGGCVVLAENTLQLPSLNCAGNVALINTVPSAMAELIRQGGVPASVRTVNLAGEALSRKLVQDIYATGTVAEVINLYGPSEDTTYTTWEVVPDDANEPVMIGRPLANTQIYLLDQKLQPVPVGVAGELYTSGAGMARGYLNRPELTAERFIPNPFSSEPGRRLYRTGDLARYRVDGRIEYLGRIDQQVKIRGFRIELGEVEAVLERHPMVQQCVVTAHANDTGDKRLVAYIVSSAEQDLNSSNLRQYLKEKLPEYMVPATFVMLAEMPLTPNGKVDRKRLPEPEQSRLATEVAYVAPRTPTEEAVAKIWSEVLVVERVGVEDNFFELGGHSLLATQVVSRLRAMCQTELPLRTLFEEPTVAALATHIDQLVKAQTALALPPLERRERAQSELSFTQQRLWFLDQLEPDSAFYNIGAAVRIEGELNTKVLEQSFEEVVRRHETLRTRFVVAAGSPVQVIDPAGSWELPIADLQTTPESEREVAFQRLATEEVRRPFDLSRGPLLRTKLFRLSQHEHVLVVTMHHIISDGWSIRVLMREIAVLVDAFAQGKPSPLPDLPVQFADFAQWQRQSLQGELLDTQLAYWKQQLADAPLMLELPLDHPRPAVQTFTGARQSLVLPAALSEAVKTLARKEGHTLFITLLAAFKALLYRYTNQTDLVIGSPVAGRNRLETEDLIGFFVNMLVLRTDISDDPTFVELAHRVREVVLEAQAHQDIPFEKLVEELQIARDLSRSPLFQVMFLLQNAAMEELTVSGVTLTPIEIDSGTAKFDLTLFVEEAQEGLVATFEYNTGLFEVETVSRLLGHFQTLLESVVADDRRRLTELPLLVESERQQLLHKWNQTDSDYPQDRLLHQWFEAQAERTPEAIALVFEEQELSYAELNERANQLAHCLRSLGVNREARVGVMLERTPALLIGLLAVLKAGGAYVPLDPQYPQERVEFMLADAEVQVLLTELGLRERVAKCTVSMIYVDGAAEWIGRESRENPDVTVEAENLAYVIYTSGSTGIPKGVAITHRSAAAFLHWAIEFFTAAKLQAVLASTSINFDLSIFELFAPLSVGGTVILAENALQLATLASASRVELINTVPSAMAELLRQGAVPASVRVINLAGEALSRKLVQEIYGLGTVAQVTNLYGPSEDTTYSTWEVVPDAAAEAVLIGRPIANTQVYLLDGELQPVAIGVTGELYLGGEGLARGYLNRAVLTAERFVPNPFSKETGGRLYRTGDLARYRADGRIEYLGRVDQQVKVRGFRIELGEIEARLEQHEQVRQCVVTAREGEGGEKQIVAYVVGEAITGSELRAYLKERLPEYMIPRSFVFLEELPLTANGKVDRKRLPATEFGREGLAVEYEAPRTPTEEVVAGIWAEVLKVERVGIWDNFFELGGHSLLATNVMFAVKEAFHVELPLRSIFESPTVSDLSQRIEAARSNGASAITRLSRERYRVKASVLAQEPVNQVQA